jgi:hypothetical protein
MDRMGVINALIQARGYRRYLEIGCQYDISFNAVQAPEKVGVDPVSGGTHRMTSDAFFALRHEPFDVVLIDGDHHHDQVFRDVGNALGLLAPGGAVVMHDCLPTNSRFEELDLCGTVWRAFAMMRERHELEAFTGDFDLGVGIVRKYPNSAPISLGGRSMDALTWSDFVTNRQAWMRPLPEDALLALIALPPESW